MVATGDLKGGTPGDWLVVGWFTEDATYRPLAEAFAANLTERGAPHHLFAKPSLGAWNTRRKPAVVLEAMDAYPGKTLVLMDVDCIVRGDIAPATAIGNADVGLALKARQTRKGKAWQKRIAVTLSSRVVVFRPTDGARAFAGEWRVLCEKAHYSGDETAMTWAFLRLPDVAYAYLDERFKAWEIGGNSMPADAVIVHASAHDRKRAWHSPLEAVKGLVRMIERRWLRTGRTKRQNIARLG